MLRERAPALPSPRQEPTERLGEGGRPLDDALAGHIHLGAALARAIGRVEAGEDAALAPPTRSRSVSPALWSPSLMITT